MVITLVITGGGVEVTTFDNGNGAGADDADDSDDNDDTDATAIDDDDAADVVDADEEKGVTEVPCGVDVT